MNIKNYIQNLKSKPEVDRKRAATTATIACMVLVGSVWVYGLASRLGTNNTETQAKADSKPFILLANSLKDTYNNISASVGNVGSISSTMKGETVPETESDVMIEVIPVEPQTQ